MNKAGKPRALLYGVGVNDYPEPIRAINDEYHRWVHMINNCHGPLSRKFDKKPVVDPRWLSLSTFIEWLRAQPNWRDYELHKGIKEAGNVVYSPDHCIMVHPTIRRVLRPRQRAYIGMPHGVTKSRREFGKGQKSYIAQGRSTLTGKNLFLGVFPTPEAAHQAWQRDKIEHLLECLALDSNRYVQSRLRRDIARIRDDIENNRETIW